jgi:hypothetical protein
LPTPFEQFPLHPALLPGLERNGYGDPTPLQAHTIPLVFDGRDVIVQAKTDAGQSLAFGLPILSLLDPGSQPQALVITANRDRCMEIWDVLAGLGGDAGLEVLALHAGVALSAQEKMLRRGADILVGTPGRIKDLHAARRLDLSKVSILVLDDASELIDQGLRREVEYVLERLSARQQTLVFTPSMPETLAAIVKRYTNDPVIVRLTGSAKAKEAELPTPVEEAPVDAAGSYFVRVGEGEQMDALVALMKSETPRRALVYAPSRHELKRLAQQIERGTTLRTGCLTRDMSSHARNSMLGRFRAGDHRVLVVADAESGLELDELTHVFHLDMPTGELAPPAPILSAPRKTVLLVTPEGEAGLEELQQRIACRELPLDGSRAVVRAAEAPAQVRRAAHGPEREPRRRNRLGATRPPAHGQAPGHLLTSDEEQRPSTGPLAPLPRLRMSWQTFKVSLGSGRRPNRDTVHAWLAESTGVPRTSLRSIVVYADHVTVEVESRERPAIRRRVA